MKTIDQWEELLEASYWQFDAHKTRKGRPMEEREAFKCAVRWFIRNAGGEPLIQPANPDPSSCPLRRIRLALSMTLGDLARASGIGTVAISEIERDKRRASPVEWAAISRPIVARMEHRLSEQYVDLALQCFTCGHPLTACEDVRGVACYWCVRPEAAK